MDAVILAAGQGTRLMEIGTQQPKCLLLINHFTLLERQIHILKSCNIEQIYIVGGHLFEQLKIYIEERNFKNIVLIQNKDYEVTNNMYSLYLTKPFLNNKNFIWLNGDIIFEKEVIEGMVKSCKSNLIAVDKSCYFNESMKVKVNHLQINEISKEISTNKAFGTSIDIYKINAHTASLLFQTIEILLQKDKTQWSEVALNQILKTAVFYPYIVQSKWVEIDDIEDLNLAKLLF